MPSTETAALKLVNVFQWNPYCRYVNCPPESSVDSGSDSASINSNSQSKPTEGCETTCSRHNSESWFFEHPGHANPWLPVVVRRVRTFAPKPVTVREEVEHEHDKVWRRLHDAIHRGDYTSIVNAARTDNGAPLLEGLARDRLIREYAFANVRGLSESWGASALANVYAQADRDFQLAVNSVVIPSLETLMFHQFGNIVVSKLITEGSHNGWVAQAVMREKLQEPGFALKLATHKCGSHAFEAYIGSCSHDAFCSLMEEVVLSSTPCLLELANSPIGNYPLQQLMKRLRAETDASPHGRTKDLFRRVRAAVMEPLQSSSVRFGLSSWNALNRRRRVPA
jgi:hypothetical protein